MPDQHPDRDSLNEMRAFDQFDAEVRKYLRDFPVDFCAQELLRLLPYQRTLDKVKPIIERAYQCHPLRRGHSNF